MIEELEGGGCRVQVAYHTDMRGQVPVSILQRFDASFLRSLFALSHLVEKGKAWIQQGSVPSAPLPRLGEEVPHMDGAQPPESAAPAAPPPSTTGAPDGSEVKAEAQRPTRTSRRRQRAPDAAVVPDGPGTHDLHAPPARRQRRAARAGAGHGLAAASAPIPWTHVSAPAQGRGLRAALDGEENQQAGSAGEAAAEAAALLRPNAGADFRGAHDLSYRGLDWVLSPSQALPAGREQRGSSPASDASIHLETIDDLLAGLPPGVGDFESLL